MLAATAISVTARPRSASGPTFDYTVLYQFCSLTNCADGNTPFAGLLRDSAGNLYGTTIFGGNGTYCTVNYVTGCGVVFKLDTAGNETTLYTFLGTADGGSPYSGVIRDNAGNIYGTTTGGGNENGPEGCGVVFKVDTNGVETVLHTFAGEPGDGCNPYAELTQDETGNLYGTTVYGGSGDAGVVFKIDTNENETILHNFTGDASDGAYPYSALIEDDFGNFYGTTQQGGTVGGGTIYELTERGALEILFSFATVDGGLWPYAGVVRDKAGNFYGTTVKAGEFDHGVVFKVGTDGREAVFHAFNGQSDGRAPYGDLIEDETGYYYGTTPWYGDGCGGDGCGTVFQVQANRDERTVHRFATGYGHPFSGLVRDPSGNLYGTTAGGNMFDPPNARASRGSRSETNDCNCGTVYKLSRRKGERD